MRWRTKSDKQLNQSIFYNYFDGDYNDSMIAMRMIESSSRRTFLTINMMVVTTMMATMRMLKNGKIRTFF